LFAIDVGLLEALRNMGDGLKVWDMGDLVCTNKSFVHGDV